MLGLSNRQIFGVAIIALLAPPVWDMIKGFNKRNGNGA